MENPQARVVEGSNGLLLEIDGEIVPNYEATFRPIEEGEVVTGHVVRIDKDEVLVDIGYKSEGVIPANELSIRKSVDPNDEVHLGEEVDAIVLTKEDQDGRLIMSKKRARFEKAWRRIETAAESGEPVEGTVIEVVKGGLIIDLGVRGFLPASLVDIRRVPNLDEYMGTKIETKVIELNRSRNNVVLSRRAVLEEERKEVRQQILDRLQPGLVVEGQISNIVDFGAFVDLDGIDGLIHISELSWSHVNHPSEILTIGDTVKVKVLDIDRDRQRISLGLKQTQEDPWQRIVDTYNVGDELEGKVTKVVTFGAFVEILDGVEGLVHISELAPHHVESPREIVHPGDEIRVKILEIDSERRRLSLSAKRVEDQILPVSRPGEPAGAAAAAGAGRPTARGRSAGAERAGSRGRRRAAAGARGRARPSRGRCGARGRGRRGGRRGAGGARRRRGAGARGGCAGAVSRDGRARHEQPRPRPPSDDAGCGASAAGGGRGAAGEATAPEPARRVRAGLTRSERRRAGGAGGALRRADRRHGRGQVDRAGGARARSARRCCRATRSCTSCTRATRSCATRSSSAGGAEVAPGGVVDRSAVAERAFAGAGGARLARGAAVAAGGRARGRLARAGARAAPRTAASARARRSSRCRCCSRPAWRGCTTRRSRSSPTSDVRRERAAARGHALADERAARQLSQEEKARRATFVVRNDGSEQELEQRAVGGP